MSNTKIYFCTQKIRYLLKDFMKIKEKGGKVIDKEPLLNELRRNCSIQFFSRIQSITSSASSASNHTSLEPKFQKESASK